MPTATFTFDTSKDPSLIGWIPLAGAIAGTQIDWGDGTVVDIAASEASLSESHVYKQEGVFTATVTGDKIGIGSINTTMPTGITQQVRASLIAIDFTDLNVGIYGFAFAYTTNLLQLLFSDSSQLVTVAGPVARTGGATNIFQCSVLPVGFDISGWDTSNVTNMQNMFYLATLPVGFDISAWNVSKQSTMPSLFNTSAKCFLLNGGIKYTGEWPTEQQPQWGTWPGGSLSDPPSDVTGYPGVVTEMGVTYLDQWPYCYITVGFTPPPDDGLGQLTSYQLLAISPTGKQTLLTQTGTFDTTSFSWDMSPYVDDVWNEWTLKLRAVRGSNYGPWSKPWTGLISNLESVAAATIGYQYSPITPDSVIIYPATPTASSIWTSQDTRTVLSVVRGDDAIFTWQFAAGETANIAGAVFTMALPDYSRVVSQIVTFDRDADTLTVHLAPDKTSVTGKYRADLQLFMLDGTTFTAWLGTTAGAVTIVDDVSKP